MKITNNIFWLAVIYGVLTTLSTSAEASLALAYDSPVLEMHPGQSIQLGATLTNTSGSGPLVTTNDATMSDGFSTTSYYVADQFQLHFIVIGESNPPYLSDYSDFSPALPNPMANLNLADGASIHLNLGTLALDPTIPEGLYTGEYGINVGVYANVSFLCPGVCNTLADVFAPPTVNAGILSVNVSPVPVPASMWLLVSALGGLAKLGYRAKYDKI